jgi:hypothetical protein
MKMVNLDKTYLGEDWKETEKKLAKEVGGKRVGGSGCHWSSKGDVKHKSFLFEVKTTEHDSYAVGLKTLIKIEREAHNVGKIPVLMLNIKSKKYIVVRLEDWKHNLEKGD